MSIRYTIIRIPILEALRHFYQRVVNSPALRVGMDIEYIFLESVGSTNDWAKSHVQELSQNGVTVISAKRQTAGRGRQGRSWHFVDGNIAMTLTFFVRGDFSLYSQVGLVSAMTLIRWCADQGIAVELKWPNDLVVAGGKLSGILSEVVSVEADLRLVAIGIGFNLNVQPDLQEPYRLPPVAFSALSGRIWDRKAVEIAFTDGFVRDISLFLEEGFLPFFFRYKKAMMHREGEKVVFHEQGKECSVMYFRGVDPTGGVWLQASGKEPTLHFSGEFQNAG